MLAIFTKNSWILSDVVRIGVGVSFFGLVLFIFSGKINRTSPQVNFILQSFFVIIYFFLALTLTGGTQSFLVPLVYLIIMVTALYSLPIGLFVFSVMILYFTYNGLYLENLSFQEFITNYGSGIFGMTGVSIVSSYIGHRFRKSLVEKTKAESYTRDVSADKSKDEAILSNIGDGIYAINEKKEMILFNSQAEKITGWKSADALGLPCKKIMNLKNEQSVSICDKDCPALQVWNTGESVVRDDLCFMAKGDEEIKLEGTYAPIKDLDGKINGAICVFRNVTKKKEVERMRSEFVSTASHELRTPITAISGYIELVSNKDICKIDGKAEEYLGKAQETTKAMSNLIRNLLVVTKLEDNKVTQNITNFPMKDSVEDIIEIFASKAKEKNISLEYEATPNLTIKGKKIGRSLNVRADQGQVKEVLGNLVENAIKFTLNGGITISIDYDNDFAKVCVSDTGVGIPEEGRKHLFEKFYQIDNSATRAVGGTGLGLYITRSIVESLGGRLWVESVVGKGSKFFFTLPRSLD